MNQILHQPLFGDQTGVFNKVGRGSQFLSLDDALDQMDNTQPFALYAAFPLLEVVAVESEECVPFCQMFVAPLVQMQSNIEPLYVDVTVGDVYQLAD